MSSFKNHFLLMESVVVLSSEACDADPHRPYNSHFEGFIPLRTKPKPVCMTGRKGLVYNMPCLSGWNASGSASNNGDNEERPNTETDMFARAWPSPPKYTQQVGQLNQAIYLFLDMSTEGHFDQLHPSHLIATILMQGRARMEILLSTQRRVLYNVVNDSVFGKIVRDFTLSMRVHGACVNTKEELVAIRGDSLPSSVDGRGLQESVASPFSNRWIAFPERMFPRIIIGGIQLRCNLIRMRVGSPRNSHYGQLILCRGNCGQPESLVRILQSCWITHDARFARHNWVARKLVKRFRRLGYTVFEETRADTSTSLIKPDLIAARERRATATDVNITSYGRGVIVYPQRKKMQRLGALVTIACIWIMALFLACPMIAFTSVSHGIIRSDASVCSASTLDSHGLRKAKLVYGGVTLVVQYLFPVTVVGFAYTRIYLKIRTRQKNQTQNQLISSRLNRPQSRWTGRNQLSSGFEDIRLSNFISEHEMFTTIGPETVQSNGRPPRRFAGPFRDPNRLLNTDQSDRDRLVHRRQIKTNALLLAITLTFILSWTPLHVFNLTMDMVETQRIDILSLVSLANQETSNHTYPNFNHSKPNGMSHSGTYLIGRNVTIIHAICLLCVHLAACINPILYGWLNENFCQIFRQTSRNYLAWCRLR
ncbi:hypothetical protein T265_05432 [Opisthorchis viverrini]|uniref:G-protein coupled receptors family 1 profile domain-containing protein n=1 Tax=Opisthorchis viverrini TaxID=6198 RepID=A0A074ZP11_OPIVI|nr:hypothetical protein T265_05432 [Opisthorchis viverrini]KER27542.1 hypothetical protein T265_05432 [Opisthorchis viverrini]